MTINKIDVNENKVTLSFNRHEITVIRKALSSMYKELTEEDRFLHRPHLKTTSSKIINCIKFHLCVQDEDYDKPIISPKFLSDSLDQMAIDGFEE